MTSINVDEDDWRKAKSNKKLTSFSKREERERLITFEETLRKDAVEHFHEDFKEDFETETPTCTCCGRTIKRWKLILSIVIGIFLILLGFGLLFWFLILPRMITSILDNSVLQFNTIFISNCQTESFLLNATASLQPDISISIPSLSASVDAMTITVSYEGFEIGTAQFPAINNIEANNGPVSLQVSSVFTIQNEENFLNFAHGLVNDQTVQWHLSGQTNIHVIGMSFAVQFAKDVSLQAMNGMSNTQLLNFNVTGQSSDSLFVIANATWNNPSVVGLDLGDDVSIEFDLYFEGSKMGTVHAPAISIVQGENSLSPLLGILKPDNMTAASDLVSRYLRGQPSSVTCVGAKALNSSIEWLQQLVRQFAMHSSLPGLTNFSVVRDVFLDELGMQFISNTKILGNCTVTGGFNKPWPFTDTVISLSFDFMLYDLNNNALLHLQVPPTPAQNLPNDTIIVTIIDIPLIIVDEHAMSNFVETVLLEPTVFVASAGVASATVNTVIGQLTLSNIPFSASQTLQGADDFQQNPVTVKEAFIVDGTAGACVIGLLLELINPTSATLDLGIVSLDIIYKDVFIGNGTLSPLNVILGTNMYLANATYIQTENDTKEGSDFFSRYLQGLESEVVLHGTGHSTQIRVLQKALKHISMPAILPGLRFKLLVRAKLDFGMAIFSGLLPCRLTVLNPFNVKIGLLGASVKAYLNGVYVGYINSTFTDPIFITPNSTTITPELYVTVESITFAELEALLGDVLLDAMGTLTCQVGNAPPYFVQEATYAQKGIPASFRWNGGGGASLHKQEPNSLLDFEEKNEERDEKEENFEIQENEIQILEEDEKNELHFAEDNSKLYISPKDQEIEENDDDDENLKHELFEIDLNAFKDKNGKTTPSPIGILPKQQQHQHQFPSLKKQHSVNFFEKLKLRRRN